MKEGIRAKRGGDRGSARSQSMLESPLRGTTATGATSSLPSIARSEGAMERAAAAQPMRERSILRIHVGD